MKRTLTTFFGVTLALCMALALAACGDSKGAAAGLTAEDFALYKTGGSASLAGTLPEGGGIEISSVELPRFQTRRGVAPGDGVEKLLEQYGGETGDFSHLDAEGDQLDAGNMTLAQFYEAGAMANFTARFLLLEIGGETYGYTDLDKLPEAELAAGGYTVYNLAFEVQDGQVESIALSSAVAPLE